MRRPPPGEYRTAAAPEEPYRELTQRQRGRVFSYHRYVETLNEDLETSA